MKVLIAPDKFKGSLTAKEVCKAVTEGLLLNNPGYQIKSLPLADGGEGTFDILTQAESCAIKTVEVLDPLFRPIQASYGITPDKKTAFIEMASASGLQLLKDSERNPLYTSSIGTGQLIADALSEKVGRIVLGIGGSATNDAGIGMASALGVKFLSAHGEILPPIGQSLSKIASINNSHLPLLIKETPLTILCDVNNPLYGPKGAAYIYAPQKGASPQDVQLLDNALKHFAQLAEKIYGIELNFEGAGAAGGIGASAKLFFDVTFEKGIQYIATRLRLDEQIKNADWIITGEGKIDDQTFSGKVVDHVIRLAIKHGKRVSVVCGQSTFTATELKHKGVTGFVQLASNAAEILQAQQNAYELLREKMSRVILEGR